MKVTVAVLGDVGRSPRMQYHALSLARLHGKIDENIQVRLVGIEGERCLGSVEDQVMIQVISDKQIVPATCPWVIRAPVRALRNALLLLRELTADSDLIVVQNPPAIPTLAVAIVACWWTGAALVIDWHNLGFKMLEYQKKRKEIVKLAYMYEKLCAKFADGHICVTNALSLWLEEHFSVSPRAQVLYDRPHEQFHRLTEDERQDLFKHLQTNNILPQDICEDIINRQAALIVSSTSWTEDEDFDMFLKALKEYRGKTPIVAIITGKGPLKSYYQPMLNEISLLTDRKVRVLSAWLTHSDYPRLLGSADLGICMHVSTSGLDLPMKVVDMFGCQLPACAVNFECLDELVKDGVNGRIFETSEDLGSILYQVLDGFPSASKLEALRDGVGEGFDDWQKNWDNYAKPLFLSTIEKARKRKKRRGLPLLLSVIAALVALLLVIVYASSKG